MTDERLEKAMNLIYPEERTSIVNRTRRAS